MRRLQILVAGRLCCMRVAEWSSGFCTCVMAIFIVWCGIVVWIVGVVVGVLVLSRCVCLLLFAVWEVVTVYVTVCNVCLAVTDVVVGWRLYVCMCVCVYVCICEIVNVYVTVCNVCLAVKDVVVCWRLYVCMCICYVYARLWLFIWLCVTSAWPSRTLLSAGACMCVRIDIYCLYTYIYHLWFPIHSSTMQSKSITHTHIHAYRLWFPIHSSTMQSNPSLSCLFSDTWQSCVWVSTHT